MFVHGTTINTEDHQMPWVLDGTHDLMNPEKLMQFSSNRWTSEAVISHPQISSMLYLLKHHCNALSYLQVEYHHLGLTEDEIETYRTRKKLPYILTKDSNYYDYEPSRDKPHFKIIMNQKWSSKLFPALDEFHKDEKILSLGLIEGAQHRVRVYKASEDSYTILTSRWTWTMARKLIALLPKLFPWFQLPENILYIFGLFGGEDYNAWCNAYNPWIQSLHLMDAVRKKNLVSALNSQRTAKINSLQSNIKDCDSHIDNYMANMRDYYTAKAAYQAQLIGYQEMKDNSGDDLYEYLTRNKAIYTYNVIGTVLYLYFRTPWTYYDQTMFDRIASNDSSTMNSYKEAAQFLKTAYCDKPRFELWSEAAVYIKLDSNQYACVTPINNQFIPQTHLHHFNCWGNNKGYIQKALGQSDYIGAIEQMIAASRNINWYDNPVVRALCEQLQADYRNLPTIKDLKTDKFINFAQAIKIIKEEQANAVHQDIHGTETVNPEAV
jgi:hypothetical protein